MLSLRLALQPRLEERRASGAAHPRPASPGARSPADVPAFLAISDVAPALLPQGRLEGPPRAVP